MTFKNWTLSGMLAVAFACCSAEAPDTTAHLVPVASARLIGTVRSSSGQPLDSAWVSLQLSGDYGSAFAFTNAGGQFAVNANRMFRFGGPPGNSDTLRVGVVVQWIKGEAAGWILSGITHTAATHFCTAIANAQHRDVNGSSSLVTISARCYFS